MILSDAPSCGVTYDCSSDDSRFIIYDRNMFIVVATDSKEYLGIFRAGGQTTKTMEASMKIEKDEKLKEIEKK
jgi:hypothetical protein